jgi:hypothetical protein
MKKSARQSRLSDEAIKRSAVFFRFGKPEASIVFLSLAISSFIRLSATSCFNFVSSIPLEVFYAPSEKSEKRVG